MDQPEIGDIVTTSYGTGPYRITGITRQEDGTLSFTMSAAPGHQGYGAGKRYWINGVRRRENRFFAHINDELFIRPGDPNKPRQLLLF